MRPTKKKKKKGQWAILKTKVYLGTSQIISVGRANYRLFFILPRCLFKSATVRAFIRACILDCFQNKAVYITDFITMVSDEWSIPLSFNISLFKSCFHFRMRPYQVYVQISLPRASKCSIMSLS